MNRAARLALLLSFVAISFAVAWDFTPRTSSHSNAKGDVATSGSISKSGGSQKRSFVAWSLNKTFESNIYDPIPQPTVTVEPTEGDEDDPDLPPGMTGKVDKEAYLLARGDYFDMLRGRIGDVPADAREKAIRQMEKQEAQMSRTGAGNSALVTLPTGSSSGRTRYRWDRLPPTECRSAAELFP